MRFKLSTLALIAGGLLIAAPVMAQTSTTGATKGIITDQATGQPVAGATVVLSGPSLQQPQAEITDGSGAFYISNVPPGTYVMTVYYAEAEFQRSNVLVQLGKTAQVNLAINTGAGKGEVITIEGSAPLIDQGSTKTGRTITPDFTQNIPTGRTFGGVLGTAAGSQGDLYGVSFGGSTSVENVYIVEGLNTTDPAFGVQSTNLPNEFVQETELITGGYNAEYGRSTGGVVNVVTKSGSNEFHGSVFSYFTPGQLVADEVETPRAGSAIDRVDNLQYRWDFGAELGGPIVKDKVWFHVGINPSLYAFDVNRLIKTQVDEDGDGSPDRDDNGFGILREVDRFTLDRGSATVFFTGKITAAVTPDHQGSISFLGNPERRTNWSGSVNGPLHSREVDIEDGAFDIAGKWSSKFNDNKTQVDAVLGWHRNVINVDPARDLGDTPQIFFETTRPLNDFGAFEMADFNGVPNACLDDVAGDPFPGITNCPVRLYNTGGLGFHDNQTTDRYAALLSVTQRFKAAGQHAVKAGVDVEHQVYDHLSDFTGGIRFRQRSNLTWRIDRFFTVVDPAEPGLMNPEACGTDTDGDGVGEATCAFQADGLVSNTTTRNIGAYLQDSWQLLPNLSLNAGIRWEQQTLFVADHIAGETSPTTGDPIPDIAFKIGDMIAPRVGLIYDPTQEGRSKVFGHWGRFYESVPMDINARAYGGEVFTVDIFLDEATQGPGCAADEDFQVMCNFDETAARLFFGGGEELVTPGLGGQYLDEVVLGGEYELLNDFKVGAQYIRRELGRVIEDVSTDGANTYIIANPGEIDQSVIDDLRAEAETLNQQAMNEPDPEQAAELQRRANIADTNADLFEGVKIFDTPTRTYDALVLTAEKRFSRNLMVTASYTLSRLEGNHPGLFSPETGQLDPNLTSQYDLPELLANRFGPLAADRTHNFKLDGYYALQAQDVGRFVFGSSVRAASGIPHNVLGAHPLYGNGESYILPRGSFERSPFTTQFDIHAAYGRKLNKNMMLEAFIDVFNVFNQQAELDVDEIYTFDDALPCVGCSREDLDHVKVPGTGDAPEVNPNFGNVNSRQAPLQVRFGARLTF